MYHDIFVNSYNKLINLEGGYVNDETDKGGETYKGISRNNFPNWLGWKIIDHAKSSTHFKQLLKADCNLEAHVQDFYHKEFWSKMKCDFVPDVIAVELFELSVNVGTPKATIILQTALNVLNNNEKKYSDIRTDALFGKITLATLRTCLDTTSNKLLFNVINILQGCFYIELMLNNPIYEKYIGWFNRVELKK